MNLNDWQEHLSAHFAALRSERKDKNQFGTIYALEHGLNSIQLEDLRQEIHKFLGNSRPADRHYLPWVVYSSEIGYRYSGEEYWDTFLELTPNWDDSYRNYIRDAYFEFQRAYTATRPQGRWADHFKIICWPITHAILPRDLQNELARVLYDLRGSYDLDLLRNPEALGQEIRDAAWNSGSRFRKFAEDRLLVGQISTALLLSGEDKQPARILASTLERISKDLDQNRRSRDWLSYARSRAHQVNIRGLSRKIEYGGGETSTVSVAKLTQRDREVFELGIEPELTLIKTAPNTWSARLKTDLTHLIRRFSSVRETIANQRCTIAGTEPRVFLKGYFLFGDQEVALNRWPSSDELLIKFEQPQPEVEHLLTTECLLRPGPIWLFKLTSETIARHVKTGTVKPGYSYIVVYRGNISFPTSLAPESVQLSCTNASAVRLHVPDSVSSLCADDLEQLHLRLSNGLELAPVGSPAAEWDEAGIGAWLSADQSLIRVTADFHVDGIFFNLVGSSPSKIEVTNPSWPLFLDLGNLNHGVHELHVLFARPGTESLIHGFLQIAIRPAKLWKADTLSAAPFVVNASPTSPSLDELWEGRATVEILGPKQHKANADITFLSGSSVRLEYKIGPFELPCSPTQWLQHWKKVTSDRDCQNAFDASSECELSVACEFGRYVMRASRELRPLRWVAKQENNGYFLRFLQLDERRSVAFSRYTFRTPLMIERLSDNTAAGFRVSDDGGLFVATTDEAVASVVIPPRIHSFKWLSSDAILPNIERSENYAGQLVRVLELWHDARAIGDLFALKRKNEIELKLSDQIIKLFCGDEWLKLEELYRNKKVSVNDFANSISRGGRQFIGTSLLHGRHDLQGKTPTENAERIYRLCRDQLQLPTFSVARDHGMSRQQWAVEFGYRCLTAPYCIRAWAAQDFLPGISYLLKLPALSRILRFGALLSEAPNESTYLSEATQK